jgi:predicted nucleotidyltransferase component of viral defense system
VSLIERQENGMAKNVGESALARLKALSKETGIAMPAILRRYAQERLLYRLSVSPEAKNFCVKGGVLLSAYYKGRLLRPSDDIDFNGFLTSGNIDKVGEVVRQAVLNCEIDDGLVVDLSSMRIKAVREGRIPGGKISLVARIGSARVELSVDVGFGNKITPEVKTLVMPTMLGTLVPAPTVLAYPIETVVSEKSAIIVEHGLINSRLKDYFDLLFISKTQEFNGLVLSQAVRNTFDFRETIVPHGEIDGLSAEFVEDHNVAWNAFLKKIDYREQLPFEDVVATIKGFISPVIKATADRDEFAMDWKPGEDWAPALTPSHGM